MNKNTWYGMTTEDKLIAYEELESGLAVYEARIDQYVKQIEKFETTMADPAFEAGRRLALMDERDEREGVEPDEQMPWPYIDRGD